MKINLGKPISVHLFTFIVAARQNEQTSLSILKQIKFFHAYISHKSNVFKILP